jgi:hypothetical protein
MVSGEVLDAEEIDRLAYTPSGKRKQGAKGIAVAPLCITGEIPLADEVLQQKPPDPGAQQAAINHDSSVVT